MNRDFVLPAMLGLGLYSQNCNGGQFMNGTTGLLLSYVLLEDHAKIKELEEEVRCCCCNGNGNGYYPYSNGYNNCCNNGCYNGYCNNGNGYYATAARYANGNGNGNGNCCNCRH